jgi:hypothetical protein
MSVIPVHAGDNLQTAINAAVAGDILELDASATFTGNYTLPVHSGGEIIIRSAGSLPPAGTRVSPASAAAFAKIAPDVGGGPAFATAASCHDWSLVGLTLLPTPTGDNDILTLGDGSSAQNDLSLVPYNLVVDRCYIHGDASTGQKRAISLQSKSTTIKNCYISNIFRTGQDSQAIAGWNGPGDWTITNNYIEAAGENFLIGGANIEIPNLIPTGVTFTGNTVTKNPAWKGAGYNVKNLLELKTGVNVLIDSNAFSYNWGGEGQSGYAIVFTVRNEEGNNPWATIANVTFSRNTITHTGSLLNILGKDDRGVESVTMTNLQIRDNVAYDVDGTTWDGAGHFAQIHSGDAITIDHNTVLNSGSVSIYFVDGANTNFTLTNTITNDNGLAIFDTLGNLGTTALNTFAAPWLMTANVLIAGSGGNYPPGQSYPATEGDVGFTSIGGNDYRLLPSSPYYHAAADGTDIGARFASAPAPPDPTPVPPASPLPSAPAHPIPADTATNVASSSVLAWNLSSDTSSYSVDFGTTNPPPRVSTGQFATSYTPTLGHSTLYYWKVTASGPGGDTAGPVWSFTTAAASTPVPPPPVPVPGTPANPTPATTATDVCPHATLSWTADEASTYDVALGLTSPPGTVSSGQSATAYTPTGLAWSTTYYWQITSISAGGRTAGPIWSFTTAAATPGIITAGVTVGALLPWVKPQFLTAAGVPVAGGFLFFYTAGTTTLQATFADVDLTTPNTNPIILDSGGQSATPIYLQAIGYKVRLLAANGSQLWERDNVEDLGQVFENTWGQLLGDWTTYTNGQVIPVTERYARINSSSGSTTIYLSAAADMTQPLTIKNMGANAVTVTPDGTDTLEGSLLTYVIPAAATPLFPSVLLGSNGISDISILASHGI